MAKKGQIFKKYSPEFKFNVILDMRTNGLSYHETVRKYELGDDRIGGTRQMVQRWERIYLEEGIEGFKLSFQETIRQVGRRRSDC